MLINGKKVIFTSLFLILWMLIVMMFFKSPSPEIIGSELKFINRKLQFIDEQIDLKINNSYKCRLIILFTLMDCPICLYESEYWGLAAKEYRENLSVVGITKQSNEDKLNEFINEYGLTFPIYVDNDLFQSIEYYLKKNNFVFATPVKLFIDNNYNLVAVEGGTKEINKHSLFLKRVEKVLEFIN